MKHHVGEEYTGSLYYMGGIVSDGFIPLDRGHPEAGEFEEDVAGQCRECGRLTSGMNEVGHSEDCPLK